jgi:ribosome-associated toxin RatA of RatAB toxin-antitoxin module
MLELRRSAIVAQPAEVVFNLVNDVGRYPEFVPGCESAEVLERDGHEVVVRLGVRRGSLTTSFTTRNRSVAGQTVHMHLVDGPFKHFDGHWHIRPLGADASEIELLLHYQFSNPIKRALLQPLFSGIAEQMVRAFVQRAQALAAAVGASG